ncbi:hypothetical protein FIBSPDRAFT_343053 [Athelia psychrophila]|uniref:Uncharacterized protein n=1 Tax=Athelia psychrophila TaxID=1759441 RepID=A0A167W7N2_9AGAM|nr:hypothetical protein FIBSPDRAFT_343053 [Fibularhizoctonia sp. CBS 109695]
MTRQALAILEASNRTTTLIDRVKACPNPKSSLVTVTRVNEAHLAERPPRYLLKGLFAIHILLTAQGLGWSPVAMYAAQQTSYISNDAVKLDDISYFMTPERIVDIAKRYNTKHPHPPLSKSFAPASLLPSLLPHTRKTKCYINWPRPRHCAYLLSRDLVVAQSFPVAPGMHVKSAANVRVVCQG